MTILWFDKINGIGQAEYLGIVYFINLNNGTITLESESETV